MRGWGCDEMRLSMFYVDALGIFDTIIEKVLHAGLRFLPILGHVICCVHCLSLSK